MSWEVLFYMVIPFVAFVYAMVGHGGASGYLAVMALFNFSPEVMRPTGLLLNIFVSGIAFWHFHKEGYFNKKLFWKFTLPSVPMAFIGGLIEVDVSIYKKILAVLLLFAIIRILWQKNESTAEIKPSSIPVTGLIGGSVGFFSGLIGIGGGIILSPVILLMNWAKLKETAAISALFIWVNSIAGLGGQFLGGATLSWNSVLLVGLAVIGGFFGGKIGSQIQNTKHLKFVLAFVLILACLKLCFT